MSRTRISNCALVLLLLAACSDEQVGPPRSVELRLDSIREAAPLAQVLVVSASPDAALRVRYWTEGGPVLQVSSSEAGQHSLQLMRLRSDRDYDYEVSVLGNAMAEPLRGSFRTSTLPAEFETISLISTGRSTAQLTMLELRRSGFNAFVAVDAAGEVVWYYRTASSSYCWTRLPNGNFVVNDVVDGTREITPLGEIVAQLPDLRAPEIHHELLARADGSIWFLQTVEREVGGTNYVGDRISCWNPDTGAVQELWNAFDFLSPLDDWGEHSVVDDWLHLNSLRVGASGNILVSSPFLNQIIAIRPDFGAIVWRMGGPNATIVPESGATFNFQHTATEIVPYRVLLFDNRGVLAGGSSFSRALEVQIAGASAAKVWEFIPPNDNYASIMSSAYRLAGGNTLIGYGPGDGLVGSVGPIEVYEGTESGAIEWHLLIEGFEHMYRATPFESIAGEIEVSP